MFTSETYRVFHAISFKTPESKVDLNDYRVVYINCNPMPGFIDDIASEISIIDGVKELEKMSALKQRIGNTRSVPNQVAVAIPDLRF